MLIQQKIGNIKDYSNNTKTIDWLKLQWFETNKRIQRKHTESGLEIAIKFLQENPNLNQGDILYEDEKSIIAIDILPCECIVVAPKNMFEMASVCYEIGNKHLPLFFDKEELLVPNEMPLYKLLITQGYIVKQEQRQLLQPLKTTVAPHGSTNDSLFSKIMKLTAPHE